MKISKKSYKKLFLAASIIAIVVVAGTLVWSLRSSDDASENIDSKPNSEIDSRSQNQSPVDENGNETRDTEAEENPDVDTQSQKPNYISSPISNPPEINDPYPIENEHYKIVRNSPTSFDITLYPIANNPDYSNYSAQLRAYKQEALDYLEKRYQSISTFTINWSPEDAKNL